MTFTALPLDAYDLRIDQVKARFDWSVRNGNPNWLWPDTTFQEWRAAQRQIETVARQVLVAGGSDIRLQGGAPEFGIAAYTSGMGPLLGYWLRQRLIDARPEVAAIIDLHYRHNTLRMERMARRAIDVVDALAERGVRVVVLKGMTTAFSYFPEPGTRPLSDIDLLIAPADRRIAGEVLLGMGFLPGRATPNPPEQNWRMAEMPALPRSLSFVHADDPWSVDLQTSLNRRYSYGAPIIDLDGINTAASLEPWGLSRNAATFAPSALVLHLACHAGCGLDSLTLIRLVELVTVIRAGQASARFSWEEFVALAERTGTLGAAYAALYLADRLAPGTVPETIMLRCERATPSKVRRLIHRLEPHSAQRLLRCSLEERFMWNPSRWHQLLQIVREIFPQGSSIPAIYRTRIFRLVRGTVTR